MATSSNQQQDLPPSPANYAPGTGKDRYCRFVEDWVNLQRTAVQDTILEALEEHEQVIAVGGNGLGKSYIAAAGGIAGLFCNKDTVVPITAGTGGTLEDNIWKPIKSLHRRSQLPGRTLGNTRELRTEIDEEWYLKCVSPRYPGDLEGDHNANVIYIVEEAEKPGVTSEHIDSARSTTTDDNDRMLVIANPPTDEGNVVHELIQSEEWHTLQFSSWESHNVQVELGNVDGEKIGGLCEISKIRKDWNEYHNEEWPGLEQAIKWSDPWYGTEEKGVIPPKNPPNEEFRDDLHTKWYKRRAGIMPPESAETWRPFTVSEVRAAYQRTPGRVRETPETVGIDVARSGDKTVMAGVHFDDLQIHYDDVGDNHEKQKPEVASIIKEWPSPGIAVDFGYAPGFHDYIDARFPNVEKFMNGTKPGEMTRFKDKWSEALFHFGEFLRQGGSISNSDLRDEALAAARTIEFSERTLDSRGENGAEVVVADSKDEIKDHLGHSPDYLDAALMTIWERDAESDNSGPSGTGVWGSSW